MCYLIKFSGGRELPWFYLSLFLSCAAGPPTYLCWQSPEHMSCSRTPDERIPHIAGFPIRLSPGWCNKSPNTFNGHPQPAQGDRRKRNRGVSWTAALTWTCGAPARITRTTLWGSGTHTWPTAVIAINIAIMEPIQRRSGNTFSSWRYWIIIIFRGSGWAPSFLSLHLRFVVNGLFVRVCLIFVDIA